MAFLMLRPSDDGTALLTAALVYAKKPFVGTSDGSAGLCKEAFRSLERKVAATREGEQVMVALMLDEMAIKKHVQWDGKKMVGFVDIGNGVFDDSAPPATEALVLMAVALNSSWKVTLGYFLIAGLTGTERANIVTTCILRLHDVGVRVVSLTCD